MALAALRSRAALVAAGFAISVAFPLTAAVGTAAPAAAAPAAKTTEAKPKAKSKAKAKNKSAKAKAKGRKLTPKQRKIRRGKQVVAQARKLRGKPYRYGATGPSSFDCSGYTQTVVRRAINKKLPRTSSAQRSSGKVDRVGKKNRRKGDLVFFHSSGGRVYHVGIYAGKGKMWHAPRPGKKTQRAKIFSSRVSYGRVV